MFPDRFLEYNQDHVQQGKSTKGSTQKKKSTGEKPDSPEGPSDDQLKAKKGSGKNTNSDESAPTFTEPDLTDYTISDRISSLNEKEKALVKQLPRLSRKERRKYRSAFYLFDKNHDGKVTAAELAAGMQALNHKFTNEEAASMVQRYAENGEGTVDFRGFLKIMYDHPTYLDKNAEVITAFLIFDQDKDGYINKEDVRNGMATLGIKVSDAEIASMFQAGDHDRDGRINFKEFVQVWVDSVKRS
uniref:EF-hand domain-containing protein n=1 Tax=Trichuris muris TaxID=70415 RepID=A0A5S6PYX1_TRIMR